MNSKPLALIIDDEPSIGESLSGVLADEGWRTQTARNGKVGLLEYRKERPQVVFLDVWMPGIDGIETLQKLRDIDAAVPIVIMSGHATIDTAVRATRLGAYEFLEKPLSLDKILPLLHQVKAGLKKNQHTDSGLPLYDLIGISTATEEVRRQIKVIAPRSSWVLITGENGTGKEVVARNIHLASPRATRPFVAVNCAAIPEELIESELFGHSKGAFTNAIANKKGRFEVAHEGTLFLDEIADMSLRTQAKILRILQEKTFERVGDNQSIQVDVRVIAATNKDLQTEIREGRFREDLFYRLNVIPISLKPLRERKEDIEILAQHFLQIFAQEMGETPKVFSAETLQALKDYAWPGNVRELKNLMERLSILVTRDKVEVEDLPHAILVHLGGDEDSDLALHIPAGATLKQARFDFEKSFILERLEENQWNVSKTADAIGIERSNLHRKLRLYDIDPKRLRG